jgi:hypothetical protein
MFHSLMQAVPFIFMAGLALLLWTMRMRVLAIGAGFMALITVTDSLPAKLGHAVSALASTPLIGEILVGALTIGIPLLAVMVICGWRPKGH